MASFDDGFWNIFIIIVTLASMFGLWIFVQWGNQGGSSKGGEAESMGHVWDGDLEELNNPLPRWWLNLFLITIAWGFLYLILYPGLGANTMVLNWWEPRSRIWPPPDSMSHRKMPWRYFRLKGRHGSGPSHMSQSSSGGGAQSGTGFWS